MVPGTSWIEIAIVEAGLQEFELREEASCLMKARMAGK
jgi:hypothetical protein